MSTDADMIAYIVDQNICYQFNNRSNRYFIPYKHIASTWYISFQIGRDVSFLDPSRVLAYPHDPDPVNSKAIEIGDYSFYMRRLKSPYSDDCIDFEKYNFSNRNHAINSCNISEQNQTKISELRLVTINDTNLLNSKVSKSRDIPDSCKKFDRDACFEHAIFTQILSSAKYVSVGHPVYRIYIRPSTHPSFKIKSEPKIHPIDIATYVLGALGSWIGFSFLHLNPIPMIVKLRDRFSNSNRNAAVSASQLTNINDLIAIHEHKIKDIERAMVSSRYRNSRKY